MSSEQRPGRVKMIDSGAETPPMRRIGDVPGANGAEPTPAPAPEPPVAKSPTLLWAGLFLLACIIGAAAVTLSPLLSVG